MWPDRRLIERLGIEHPILLAPMAGAGGPAMAIAVARAGGLAALPCAMLDAEGIARDVVTVRAGTPAALNLNFFCHTPQADDAPRQRAWRERLAPCYRELGLDPATEAAAANRSPFDATTCALVESLRPEVVSFHFGLPAADLLARVRATGALVLASATSVAEARWLVRHGCDAVIAQGVEAGGHRGMFLEVDPATQAGTLALLPAIVDAVDVPVIAAGGIGDGRGIAAALALGAAAVQLGTAYLRTPESLVSPLHRAALAAAEAPTALTNLFSGRPARGLVNRLMREYGPLSDDLPPFPTAGRALAPLKQAAEALGRTDFSSLWAGEAYALARDEDATRVTRRLVDETRAALARLTPGPAGA
ncbi:MAG: nitronate monooxygenase [Rhodocyclaceae bacterium]|nr:nitronate monooxygenase [Rhodocyclaceae bacterium]